MQRRVLLAMFVILLFGMHFPNTVSVSSSFSMGDSRELRACGGTQGHILVMDSLVGISKELVMNNAKKRLNGSHYLITKYKHLEFSKALVLSSLGNLDRRLIRRDLVIIPVNDSIAVVYVRDTTNTQTLLSTEITLHEELLVFELDPSTGVVKLKTRVQPLDGWSPVCSDTVCTSTSDCPDRSSEGLYFPSCSDDCRDCTDWDYYCVGAYGVQVAACSVSCASCLMGHVGACLGCLACVLMSPYTPDIFESCCEGQVIKKCEYYEWWD